MIRIAMCDDDIEGIHNIARIIESIIISIDMNAEIVCITDDQAEIYELIKNKQIDVLFLDIDFRNKNQKSGLDFGKDIRKIDKDFYLIFLTAHFEYVGLGYECKAFRYIMKPADKNIFEDCMIALKEDTEFNTSRFFRLNSNTVIKLSDIVYIEKDSMKANICTNKEIYTIYKSLDRLLTSMPGYFSRSHKSYIVNTNKITFIDFKNHNIQMNNGSICPIGRKYIDFLSQMNK